MQTTIIDEIRRWQSKKPRLLIEKNNIEHKPGMLLIGCVDARVDPLSMLGINPGDALIYRNPGAQVRPFTAENAQHENLDIAATLEFAVKMGVKEIAVLGHTHCGAIAACGDSSHIVSDEFPSLTRYLAPFKKLWSDIFSKNQEAKESDIHSLTEHESIKKSIENLRSYPSVQQFISSGGHIHGLLVDIRKGELLELNPLLGQFESVSKIHPQSKTAIAI